MSRFDEPALARSYAICCNVAAEAVLRVRLESLPELRRDPSPSHGEPVPACFLKHADEQTVVGLCAVYQAIRQGGLQACDFRDWGVLAAPRFLGRATMTSALQRFAAEGAWGVSPHLIPHRSLHSISGTVSQALKMHGPNFGVGGGPEGVVEALLAATSLLECRKLPGVWVVLTCLDPDLPPDGNGQLPPDTQAMGLALALMPIGRSACPVRLRVIRGTPDADTMARALRGARFDPRRLETLLKVLHEARGETTIVQLLDADSRLELAKSTATSVFTPVVRQRLAYGITGQGSYPVSDASRKRRADASAKRR